MSWSERASLFALGIALAGISCPAASAGERRVISLDGPWQIAQGAMDAAPARFDRTAPVPGLADMARPAFEAVGVEKESRKHREAFWYRRSFRLEGPLPAVARLKIHKAKFGTRVFLNGKMAGDHAPCFTPALFDVRDKLRGGGAANEIVVRVGAARESLPPSYPRGWDFEKVRYIPGIYDSVELILTGTPYIARVQTVPDLQKKAVRVVAVLHHPGTKTSARLGCRVLEASTEKVAGSRTIDLPALAAGEERTAEVTVPIENCRLWSPEDPFLYRLDISTGADTVSVRFGMRSFRFDAKTKTALLNGRPYPLRGTNVCIYRFFEDPERGDRPWRTEWVRRLHRVFRSMHWNAARYCIGFPPERWYDIADEEGLLIQDEFPIWYLSKWPKELKKDELVREYTEWMRERWNHPCVVIWDAQNETRAGATGEAIDAVRHLDLSNRPWDNGWSEPRAPLDVYEAHPYFFMRPFRLEDIAELPPTPGAGGVGGNVFPNRGKNPVVINEYGWLWLNRDGSPTTLSKKNYERILGPGSTTAERRELYARYLAALTGFWRGGRQTAGVLHFCGLGYSRPGGQTSDHFTDLEKLALEPDFARYVRDAFAPAAVVLDFWGGDLPAGRKTTIGAIVLNDLYEALEGSVRLRILRGGAAVFEKTQPVKVAAVGRETVSFDVTVPRDPGRYELVAALLSQGRETVRSHRKLTVLTEAEKAARDGIAGGRKIVASSEIDDARGFFPARFAVDGKRSTRWSSEFSDPQWIAVDLGSERKISRVELAWEAAYGKSYAIQVSPDGKQWTDVYRTGAGDGGVDDIRFAPTAARWVRMHGTRRGGQWGYSLWEMKVFP